jgi:DNA invertase Pin-like site-specific DNA recombinase
MTDMRAALYARVSTDRQETENQLVQLRGFCSERGWDVTQEYVDEAVRGREIHKPQLEMALLGAHQRKYDILVFWALDRVERRGALDTLKMLDELTKQNVKWVSYMERYLDSAGPFAEAAIALVATFAKMESERKSERIKASFSRLREVHKDTGEWKTRSGKPPNRPRKDYGIQSARIVEMRAQGLSWAEITTRTGIPPTSARRLAKSVVSALETTTHSEKDVSGVSNG